MTMVLPHWFNELLIIASAALLPAKPYIMGRWKRFWLRRALRWGGVDAQRVLALDGHEPTDLEKTVADIQMTDTHVRMMLDKTHRDVRFPVFEVKRNATVADPSHFENAFRRIEVQLSNGRQFILTGRYADEPHAQPAPAPASAPPAPVPAPATAAERTQTVEVQGPATPAAITIDAKTGGNGATSGHGAPAPSAPAGTPQKGPGKQFAPRRVPREATRRDGPPARLDELPLSPPPSKLPDPLSEAPEPRETHAVKDDEEDS